ncbi:hypothetical protein BDY21DRAFT_342393 [Lineolata rhizophorae]|uniref:Tyrosinase copper-binding domain-containing protein n=1 Tax=Lineolata rhizophorae TaxID=578093 RepID=A0A6A6P305_9PEZI|nr:hypothetical protein BDY21DRAFT_342393 [Lineolata rhizophorae]
MVSRSVLEGLFASLLGLSLLTAPSFAGPISKRAKINDLADTALENVHKILSGNLTDGSTHTTCTSENVAVRKEFGDMSEEERADYVRSVNCLLNTPSRLDPEMYPGAVNRYDDFVVLHMNMTPTVHMTANFVHWHRAYVWAYESALRDECGYQGYQPYWDWSKYPDPLESVMFSGSDTSMSGNGEYIEHEGHRLGMSSDPVPPGKGGGCVQSGPFANMTVNLGPVMVSLDIEVPANPQSDGYGLNPRCIRRDIGDFFTSQYLLPDQLATHIESTDNVLTFQTTLQTDTAEAYSFHTGGHYTIWGDPGGDFLVSPGDPMFWLHHGQVDRHWWIWQNQDPEARVQQYEGPTVMMDPSSPEGKLTDVQELAHTAPQGLGVLTSGDLVSTTAGPLCYVYV